MDTSTPAVGSSEDGPLPLANPLNKGLSDLSPENIDRILNHLPFEDIAQFRELSRVFNKLGQIRLSAGFNSLRNTVGRHYARLKYQLPSRRSAWLEHPLARKLIILETLYTRVNLLHLTFNRYMESGSGCFFPGWVIDECYLILEYIAEEKPKLIYRPDRVTRFFMHYSSMAINHFKDEIEPCLSGDAKYIAGLVPIRPKFNILHASIYKPYIPEELPVDLMEVPKSYLDKRNSIRKEYLKFVFQSERNTKDVLRIRQALKVSRIRLENVARKADQFSGLQRSTKDF